MRSMTCAATPPSREIGQDKCYDSWFIEKSSLAFAKGMALMDKAQVESLESKHQALHALIDEEEHRPHPDEDLLHRLKKEKLRVKDALAGHFAH